MSLVQVAMDQAQERLAAQGLGRKNGAADRKTSIAQLQFTDEKRDSDRGRRSIATCRPYLLRVLFLGSSWILLPTVSSDAMETEKRHGSEANGEHARGLRHRGGLEVVRIVDDAAEAQSTTRKTQEGVEAKGTDSVDRRGPR